MSRSDIGETASELRREAFQTVFGHVVCRVLVKGAVLQGFCSSLYPSENPRDTFT